MQSEVLQEIARREIASRFDALESEVSSLSKDLDAVTAKNIDLSRRETAAVSRVKELEKAIKEKSEEGESGVHERDEKIAKLAAENEALEKNLEQVLKAKDATMKQLEREATDAKREARDAKAAMRDMAKELTASRKESEDAKFIAANTEKPIPKQLVIRKEGAHPVIVDVVMDEGKMLDLNRVVIS